MYHGMSYIYYNSENLLHHGFMRGYSSVVEHLTADQEVSGSIPDAPLPLASQKLICKQN